MFSPTLMSRIAKLLDTGDIFQHTPRVVAANRPSNEGFRYKSHNGAQEMARRVRQMNRTGHCPSLITVAVNGRRYHTNSHGEVCPFPGKNRRDRLTVS